MNPEITIRAYTQNDLADMMGIWNSIVAEGDSFPQDVPLDAITAPEFFAGQSYTAIATHGDTIVGLYILHPNSIGRCGHIANASFAVKSGLRGLHIGEKLVLDCLRTAKALDFAILQFNAVVVTNLGAIKLYNRLGFTALGTVPKGFRKADGTFEDITVFYKEL